MALGKYTYGPCLFTPEGKTEKESVYHFCSINTAFDGEQSVYPIGQCRENNKKGATPCAHKTEQEAIDCYRMYERKQFVAGNIDVKDILFPEELAADLKTLSEYITNTHPKK